MNAPLPSHPPARHPLRATALGSPADAQWLKTLICAQRRLKRGEALYRAGGVLESLYLVRSGWLKVELVLVDGRTQVVGFPLAGELVGLDAIGRDRCATSAIALEDSEVDVIPLRRLNGNIDGEHEAARRFSRLLSAQLARTQGTVLLLGQMRAEQRLAAFLLDLSTRLARRAHCVTTFTLRMTRDEIGGYLGMKLETVSRGLTRLQRAGLIHIRGNREVTLSHRVALQRVVDGARLHPDTVNSGQGPAVCCERRPHLRAA